MAKMAKRKDGRYAVQIYLGMVDGKRKVKTVYGKTVNEVNKKADEVRRQLNRGLDPTDSDNFSDWTDYFLNYKRIEVTPSRYKLIQARCEYWKQALQNRKISKIRPVDLQPAFNELAICNPTTGKPSSKNTLTAYKQILVNIFDYAIDNKLIDYNPATRLVIAKNAPKAQRRALTQDERDRIIEFEHRGQLPMMLMMFSGLRRGEATALNWSDINFQNNTISVTKSYDFKQGKLKAPKNGKSRIVTVPQILIDYLKTVPKTSTLVLTAQNGGIMTETAWKRLLQSYFYDMNLKYGVFTKKINKYAPEKVPMMIETFTPHCLRHTFCTMMYEAGVDVLVAQHQMGHSDVKTTLSIYTHLSSEHQINKISKLDDYLKKEDSIQNSSQEA